MANRVLDAPERIWLVCGDGIWEEVPFSVLGEVSWCDQPQFDEDVEYVRADLCEDDEAWLARLRAERARADRRYGRARDRGYSAQDWLTALVGEVGEVARAIDKAEGRDRAIEELVQVAGVALAAVEALGAEDA